MARIEFPGVGAPIPPIALPPVGSGEDIPQTVLTFTESTQFPVKQYRDLGFTHFEATCVGAAGGKGGDASSVLYYAVEEVWRPVPQWIWDLYLEATRIRSYLYNGVWDFPESYYVPGYPPNQGFTSQALQELLNPYHLMQFFVHRQLILRPSYEGIGGAGGGGGLHKVAGALDTLPDTVPIVVGKSGSDSPIGQARVPGIWEPTMQSDSSSPYGISRNAVLYLGYIWDGQARYPVRSWQGVQGWERDPAWAHRFYDIMVYLDAYTHEYPLPHNTYSPPEPGGNGGASTFAGGVAQASGGAGGVAGKVWDGSKYVIGGHGGDGGSGGRSVAGGGGKGSTVAGVNGADGIWRPETGIGGGGGGGKAGHIGTNQGLVFATAGGQGSYSYADASVYGPRQFRQPYTVMVPIEGNRKANIWPPYYTYMNNYVQTATSGLVTYMQVTSMADTYDNRYSTVTGRGNLISSTPNLLVPGGGGGARPAKSLKYGSRSPGYSPDGVVILRLTRIEA